MISGGFHAPTGAEPPWKEKNVSPPWTNSWIRPWICSWTNLRVISNKFQLDRKLWLKIQFQVFTLLSIILPDIKKFEWFIDITNDFCDINEYLSQMLTFLKVTLQMILYLFRFPSVVFNHPETHRGVVGTRHKLTPDLINNIQ